MSRGFQTGADIRRALAAATEAQAVVADQPVTEPDPPETPVETPQVAANSKKKEH